MSWYGTVQLVAARILRQRRGISALMGESKQGLAIPGPAQVSSYLLSSTSWGIQKSCSPLNRAYLLLFLRDRIEDGMSGEKAEISGLKIH
jgi:hypothetical protein